MSLDGDGKGVYHAGRSDDLGQVGFLLFDSLVHHLIEKGVLTKNDALSVVQTAAQVVRSQIHGGAAPKVASASLAALERIYSSFEAVPDRSGARLDGHNVHTLRPPLHDDRPRFPPED